mgnify:CR=1 FL=1
MSRFLQLHVLTSYPPSNLNRDDTGRPKTALLGNAQRLRVSSQSLKRAWRTSETFEQALAGQLGTRTKRLGHEVHAALVAGGIAEKTAREWTRAIAGAFGKPKSDKKSENNEDLEIEQLAHLSPEERAAVQALTEALVARREAPTEAELKLLTLPRGSVDIALFGRMLADSPAHNVEAAAQVAHAITVHAAAVEDDYFTAVDDLNKNDPGAAHLGERGYGAGLFYLYLCIDRELLAKNLGDDDALVERALRALLRAVCTVSPTGMQNSFASRAYASFALAEKGAQQPRSLAQAFLKPIQARRGQDESELQLAIAALQERATKFDAAYGACAEARYTLDVEAGTGSLDGLSDFAAS